MKGTHVTDLLSGYVDQALDQTQSEQVKTHLIFCNVCRNQLKDLEANKAALKDLPVQSLPIDLMDKIVSQAMENLKQQPDTGLTNLKFQWTHFFLSPRIGILVASVLVIFGLWEFLPSRKESLRDSPSVKSISSVGKEVGQLSREGVRKNQFNAPSLPKPLKEDAPVLHDQNRMEAKAAFKRKEDFSENRLSLPSQGSSIKALPEAESPPLLGLSKKESGFGGAKSDTNWELAGSVSGVQHSYQTVITNSQEMKRIWSRHIGSLPEKPILPELDFSHQDVLALFGGQQMETGIIVRIIRIENTDWDGKPARLVLYRLENGPSSSGDSSSGHTPYLFKAVSKASGPTFFRLNP